MMTDDPNGARRRYPSDQVLRETMLYRATFEDRIGLDCLGEVVRRYLLEYNVDGQTMRDALVAAGKDLRHLEGYLFEIAEAMSDAGAVGRSGKTLTEIARSCARRLRRTAGWVERELDITRAGDEEKGATDPPAD